MRGWAVLVALVACESGPRAHTLRVDVVTDLVPLLDFDRLRIRFEGPSAPTMQEVAADGATDWVRGARLGTYSGPEGATVRFEVQALLLGEVVMGRAGVTQLTNDVGATVLLTRSCRGVRCPEASDAAATACLGGRCVVPSCLEGDEAACPSAACQLSEDCPAASVACARAGCRAGVCLIEAEAVVCGGDELCSPERGCVPRPRADTDAAIPEIDGGSSLLDSGLAGDAETSPDDAGGFDVGPPDTGPPDTGPPDTGPPDTGPTTGAFCDGLSGALFCSEADAFPEGASRYERDGGLAQVSSARAYSGSSSLRFFADPSATHDSIHARANFTFPAVSSGTLAIRARYYIEPDSSFTSWVVLMELGETGSGKISTDAQSRDNLALINTIGNEYETSADDVLPFGRWFCLETVIELHPSAGAGTIYLDDVAIATESSVTTMVDGIDGAFFGIIMGDGVGSDRFEVYVDDMAIATERIGCD